MNNSKVLLFAGTTEGRELANYLSEKKIQHTACVATEYGECLIQEGPYCRVSQKRLSVEEMIQLIREDAYTMVIDATHPFADIVTDNIQKACIKTGVPRIRVVRPTAEERGIVRVKTTEEATNWLQQTTGNILLTTGSKTLESFTKMENYKERIYIRLLPMPSNLEKCIKLGFGYDHLIAMQGPFSCEMNKALINYTKSAYLVTKDSGTVGGVYEKIQAAKALDVTVILIERPSIETGYSLEQTKQYLKTVLEEEEIKP